MSKILITGATGNVGIETIRHLTELNSSCKIIAGIRSKEKARKTFNKYPKLELVHFHFEDVSSFNTAFNGIDTIFLLRPPHISDIDKYFKPLILKLKENNVKQLVFLSVQGAEKSTVIPHNKIERLIQENGLNYIFLRPSYFMQNLTTTLAKDIQQKRKIILPAGKAKFNWIDVENIGEVSARLLCQFKDYQNSIFELTGLENENFSKVTELINRTIKKPIKYINVNPLRFLKIKKKEGMGIQMIIVMTILHYLPRFQSEPRITNFYEQLTGKKPTDLKTFIEREKEFFECALNPNVY